MVYSYVSKHSLTSCKHLYAHITAQGVTQGMLTVTFELCEYVSSKYTQAESCSLQCNSDPVLQNRRFDVPYLSELWESESVCVCVCVCSLVSPLTHFSLNYRGAAVLSCLYLFWFIQVCLGFASVISILCRTA